MMHAVQDGSAQCEAIALAAQSLLATPYTDDTPLASLLAQHLLHAIALDQPSSNAQVTMSGVYQESSATERLEADCLTGLVWLTMDVLYAGPVSRQAATPAAHALGSLDEFATTLCTSVHLRRRAKVSLAHALDSLTCQLKAHSWHPGLLADAAITASACMSSEHGQRAHHQPVRRRGADGGWRLCSGPTPGSVQRARRTLPGPAGWTL